MLFELVLGLRVFGDSGGGLRVSGDSGGIKNRKKIERMPQFILVRTNDDLRLKRIQN